MNGVELTSAPPTAVTVIYPDGDGKPMAETGIHVMTMLTLIAVLRSYYGHRGNVNVYVIGNIFLYYEEGNPKARRSPDLMVIKGVDGQHERRSFKVWEERAVPCVVIEITSEETAEEDLGAKKELYQRLGVREYFLFDPLREYLKRPLMGFRLIGDEYEPLQPAADGGLLSQELGLRMVPEGTQLALIDFRTGTRLAAPSEAYELLEETAQRAELAEKQVELAEKQAELAKKQVELEHLRAEQAEKQAEKAKQRTELLEAELARLRGQLPPPAGAPSGPELA